ncbi:MAG TPA: response regulator, partial [Arenibaculum sp.]|nr:response regulator [Arenibaculum sp.]
LSSVMERQGHRVRTATDGLQAVVAVASERFDVVVMDMQMPELDGAEAVRLIRAMQGPGERVPIVALTADQRPEQRIRHLSTDLDAYLTKPVDWQQLDRVMRSLSRRPGTPAGPAPAPASASPPAGRSQAETRPEAVPLIDGEMLAELEAAVGPVRRVELLERFAASAEAEIARLTAAHADGDTATIRNAAHELKGLCGTFGIRRLLLLTTAIEESAADPAALGPLLRRLADAFRATVASLSRR